MATKISERILTKLRGLKSFIEQNYNCPERINKYLDDHTIYYQKRSLFKEVYGFSSHEYMIQVRMDNAKRLLKESGNGLKVVAPMVGYSTKQSFVNAFKKHTGMTPGQYRKSIDIDEMKKLPEDLFTESELDNWATRNGYSRVRKIVSPGLYFGQ